MMTLLKRNHFITTELFWKWLPSLVVEGGLFFPVGCALGVGWH
jgi:hypothetical protein